MVPNLAFTYAYNGIARQPLTRVVILDDKQKVLYEGTALWDTGASSSCITNNVAKSIGLPVVGEGFNKGVNNVPEKCDIYYANVGLPNQVMIPMQLIGIADRDDFAMLIGMDVISQGEFALCTHGGTTKLSFCLPGRKHIDFVEEINGGPKQIIGRRSECPCGSGKKYKNCCERR